ncbi:unnamed protein product [Heligmosomoides polygyrus]|uniref:Uncharacterized protein n=1 Tax=Heligmosomoides polygyrus TaxID=6339 RepID=A0A183FKV4_HELPZ|nr:unnamed protein product [Heligmosomoides polygyrus]
MFDIYKARNDVELGNSMPPFVSTLHAFDPKLESLVSVTITIRGCMRLTESALGVLMERLTKRKTVCSAVPRFKRRLIGLPTTEKQSPGQFERPISICAVAASRQSTRRLTCQNPGCLIIYCYARAKERQPAAKRGSSDGIVDALQRSQDVII